jgi:Leucine-rich repeat (LRR) protein
VQCESGVITDINVPGTYLMATIPPEFGLLTTLRRLDISSNLIFGTIPQDVASLPHMEIYNMSHNQISGNFPRFASKKLQAIDVYDNRLMGGLHADIGFDHPSMTNLNLQHNRLLGTIPESISNMKNLQYLTLTENSFYGSLPATFGELLNLEYFYVDNNRLVGEIPASLASRHSKLKEAWFQRNMFSGVVPPEFAEIKTLTEFYVDDNKLTGYLPKDLCRPELNKDFFDDYPEFYQIAGTTDRDFCESIACPPDEFGNDGIWPCYQCPSNSTNPYLGQYGGNHGDACYQLSQTEILHELYDGTNGDNWVGGNNWFFKGFDECDFTGVTCNNQGHVMKIELVNMGLSGTIEESLGFLEHLEVLDLSKNDLVGFLPSDLRFAPLTKLDISNNLIKGVVPPKLCMKRINGNGNNGMFLCDNVACPEGTYSSNGVTPCQPCDDGDNFLGKTICGPQSFGAVSPDERSGGQTFGVFIGIVLLIVAIAGLLLLAFQFVSRRRGRKEQVSQVDELDDFDMEDVHLGGDGDDDRIPRAHMFNRQVA